jgi:hypothetical protein
MLREAEAAAATAAAQDFITSRHLPGGMLLGLVANRALSRAAHKYPIQLAIAAGVAAVAVAGLKKRRAGASGVVVAMPPAPSGGGAQSSSGKT